MSESQNLPGQQPSAQPGEAAPKQRWFRRITPGRKLLLPMLTLGLMAVILVTFHTILLPFVFACVIVYLMEPIVRRMAVKFPRWVAVIAVYLSFFGVLTLGFVFVVPRFINELGRFAETVPETVASFRNENLPGINEKVQKFFRDYLPVVPQKDGDEFDEARRHMRQAWTEAANYATATAVAQVRARAASKIEFQIDRRRTAEMRQAQKIPEDSPEPPGASAPEIPPAPVYRGIPQSPRMKTADFYGIHGAWAMDGDSEKPVIRVAPGKKGDFEIFLDDGEVVVTQLQDNTWSIQRPSDKNRGRVTHRDVKASIIDLEARVNEMIESAVSTSHERVASLISYTHVLVVGIIQALVTIILTFMVAAFMSIDLPRFTGFFRDMLPADYRAGYDDLLSRIDRGLSGVVRGQLIICLVNGVLTYIGLVFLGVKFSLMLALIAGVLSLIPVFGTVISTIPIVLVGLMDSFWTALLAFAWIMLIHFVEANILNPQIIGTSAHIHPVIVIFALLAGESAFGLVGALLAVPAASILLEIFKFTRDKMSEEGDPAPAALAGSDGSAEP